MNTKFSFVTNATLDDGVRLEKFVPQVLSVFGDYIDELLIVVDSKPEEGRIKKLHGRNSYQKATIDDFRRDFNSSKVKIVKVDYTVLDNVSEKWFGEKGVNRCQNGTPIFAFLYGIEQCKNDMIIRSDCDILFYDKGFLDELRRFENDYDIIQLPFLNNDIIPFSTRAFFINRQRMNAIVPLRAHKLDIVRRLHRFIFRRESYLALEQILDKEIEHFKIKFHALNTEKGYTMHIPRRDEFPALAPIIKRFSKGDIPKDQLLVKHDYHLKCWMN